MNEKNINNILDICVDFNRYIDTIENDYMAGNLSNTKIQTADKLANLFVEMMSRTEMPDNELLQNVFNETLEHHDKYQKIKDAYARSLLNPQSCTCTHTTDKGASDLETSSLPLIRGERAEFQEILNTLTEEEVSILRDGLWLLPEVVYNRPSRCKPNEMALYSVIKKCGPLFDENKQGDIGLHHCDCDFSKVLKNNITPHERGMQKAFYGIFHESYSFRNERRTQRPDLIWLHKQIPKGPIQVCSLGSGGCLIDLIFIGLLKHYGYGPIEYIVNDTEYKNPEMEAPGALAAIVHKLYDDVKIKACQDFKEIHNKTDNTQLVVAFDADWIESPAVLNEVNRKFSGTPRFYYSRAQGRRYHRDNSTNTPNDIL